MMMYSLVLKQKKQIRGPMADDQATTPESERNLEKKNSSTDVSDGYKEMAKPQMSNLLHDSSLHSRDETTTPTHQTDQKKKKKNKKKKNKYKSNETDESPMILKRRSKLRKERYQRRERDFPTIPYLPTKETLTRLTITSILDSILMTIED